MFTQLAGMIAEALGHDLKDCAVYERSRMRCKNRSNKARCTASTTTKEDLTVLPHRPTDDRHYRVMR